MGQTRTQYLQDERAAGTLRGLRLLLLLHYIATDHRQSVIWNHQWSSCTFVHAGCLCAFQRPGLDCTHRVSMRAHQDRHDHRARTHMFLLTMVCTFLTSFRVRAPAHLRMMLHDNLHRSVRLRHVVKHPHADCSAATHTHSTHCSRSVLAACKPALGKWCRLVSLKTSGILKPSPSSGCSETSLCSTSARTRCGLRTTLRLLGPCQRSCTCLACAAN